MLAPGTPFAAVRLARYSADRLRQKPHGLHLPLAQLRRFLSGHELALRQPDPPCRATARPAHHDSRDRSRRRMRPSRRRRTARLAKQVARRLRDTSVGDHRFPTATRVWAAALRYRTQPASLPEMDCGFRRDACAQPRRPRHLPRRRRDARDVLDGRRTQLLGLRRHHGPQRQLLPLHELRLHQRLQLERFLTPGILLHYSSVIKGPNAPGRAPTIRSCNPSSGSGSAW